MKEPKISTTGLMPRKLERVSVSALLSLRRVKSGARSPTSGPRSQRQNTEPNALASLPPARPALSASELGKRIPEEAPIGWEDAGWGELRREILRR